MVGPRKRCVVVLLRVDIRRVAVDQGICPVIDTDQRLKIPVLDLNLAQAILHLGEIVDPAIQIDLAGLI